MTGMVVAGLPPQPEVVAAEGPGDGLGSGVGSGVGAAGLAVGSVVTSGEIAGLGVPAPDDPAGVAVPGLPPHAARRTPRRRDAARPFVFIYAAGAAG